MSSKTKIFVLHMREVILTAMVTVLLLLCIIFFLFVLSTHKDSSSLQTQSSVTKGGSSMEQTNAAASSVLDSSIADSSNTEVLPTESNAVYVPGIYRTVLYLNEQSLDIEVTVDEYNITSISLLNLSDSMNTMYPLLSTTFDNIREQLYQYQDPELVTFGRDNKYTSLVLLEAISKALEKAALP